MHFIPGGHWYPESGSIEQNVSGMANALMETGLKEQQHRIIISYGKVTYEFSSVVFKTQWFFNSPKN